jgi:hypothetical protein
MCQPADWPVEHVRRTVGLRTSDNGAAWIHERRSVMSDADLPDVPRVPDGHSASDGLEERGQGAGRLLGEGAEQGIAGDQDEHDAAEDESTDDEDDAEA